MACFSSNGSGHCLHWACDPDADAVRALLVEELKQRTGGALLPAGTVLSSRQQGNLGEFVAFFIGNYYSPLSGYFCFAVNAFKPLDDISRPDIDIVWIRFGAADSDDFAVLQEIKTTRDSTLGITTNLIGDYRKLFGTDPMLQLKARLANIKNILEFSVDRPDLASRVNAFIGVNPAGCTLVGIQPTLVYDTALAEPSRAEARLDIVRTTLVQDGWSSSSFECWAVGINDLPTQLGKLAIGA